jgi:hypothetical protein
VKNELVKILDEMEFLAKMRVYHCMPNTRTYTQIMTALGGTKLRVEDDARRLFTRMKRAHQEALEKYNGTFDLT